MVDELRRGCRRAGLANPIGFDVAVDGRKAHARFGYLQ
jgi:hypothetical protein